MDLRAREELKLPLARAWAEVTNVAGFEKLLRDRGAQLERSAEPDPPGLGTTWTGSFEARGQRREVSAEITRFDAPEALDMALQSAGLEGVLQVRLAEAGKSRTEVAVTLTLAARTLKAKIFMQPMKLAHGTMQDRFAGRVSRLARALEKKRRPRV
jgi:hypothetical protein